MADTLEHVNLELVDAGANTARVIQVLSKVTGLSMPPAEIIESVPCIIAEDVPRAMAEKLQTFLEKAGAMVELREPGAEEEEEFELELDSGEEELELELDDGPEEPGDEDEEEWLTSEAISGPDVSDEGEKEEDLFSPDDFPVAEELHEEDLLETPAEPVQASEDEPDAWILDENSHAGEGDSGDGQDGPSDDFGGFSAATPVSDEDVELDEDDDLFGDEEGLFGDEGGEEFDAALEEEAAAPKATDKLKGLFSKVADSTKKKDKKKKEKPKKKISPPKLEDDNDEKPEKKKFSLPFLSKKAGPEAEIETESEDTVSDESEPGEKKASAFPVGLLVPALIGFVIGALLFGVWGMMSKRSLKKELANIRSQTGDLAQLQSQNTQLQQKIQQQTKEIESLKQQAADAGEPGDRTVTPQSISPSPVPDGANAEVLAAVLSSFEALKNTHIEKLAQSAETQKQAPCSQQVLLDGEGISTYAKVVKKFSSKYTAFDVMRSNSLVTPFVAELKIPFKQEQQTGANEKACNAATLKELPTPRHHEFGNFYGIWTIEYQYKNGKWIRKSTVKEQNRALYEKAFKVGSPDYAKFLIDDKLYPGFKN